MGPPSYKLVNKAWNNPHEYYSYIYHKPLNSATYKPTERDFVAGGLTNCTYFRTSCVFFMGGPMSQQHSRSPVAACPENIILYPLRSRESPTAYSNGFQMKCVSPTETCFFTATMWIRAPCSYTATSMVAKWNSFNGRACLYMVISY